MAKLNSILLIDDDPINNFLNERLITKLNICYHVKVSLNGEEGINYLKENCLISGPCPELIFLDINMPVMNGFEFIKALDNIQIPGKEKIKIVVLTTSKNQKDLETLRALGNFDFINKPLTEEKLFNCLTKILV